MKDRSRFASAAVLLGVLTAVVAGELLGWPFLALPLQQLLSDTLGRNGRWVAEAGAGDAPDVSHPNAFRIRFVGGLRLEASQFEVAAPLWSSAPYLLRAGEVALELRYTDLWRAYFGDALRVQRLQAESLDVRLERLADGRASWRFGPHATPADAVQPMRVPAFGDLQVTGGMLRYRDVPLAIDVEARLSAADAATTAIARQGAAAAPVPGRRGMQVQVAGSYRGLPLKIDATFAGARPWSADPSLAVPLPVTVNATIGHTNLVFKGSATDALYWGALSGRFSLKGPSLAVVGDPLGVTLPTTAAFRAAGVIVREGKLWRVVIDDATVGSSGLNGAFTFDPDRTVPLLSGRLGGKRLMLADLGPVVGTAPVQGPATPAAAAAAARAASPRTPPGGTGKVLPDRAFDLAAMRAMDANVLIDIDDVDLNTRLLEPLRALRGHLQLHGGVLTLNDLDARTAEGRLRGDLALDGRAAVAVWNSQLRWDGVRLERWIHVPRGDASSPFIAGRMNGRVALRGQGRSTAEILASLSGQLRTELHGGAVSKMFVQKAGLNLAHGVGALFEGDTTLPVLCAVADLEAVGGVFRPRVMVLDTADSAIWVDGTLSLATETLDLRAVVSPKEFSLLALRSPLRVRGSFAHPEVSLQRGPMGRKLATMFALALVNPFAALVPLVDPGDAEAARRNAQGCAGLTARAAVASESAR